MAANSDSSRLTTSPDVPATPSPSDDMKQVAQDLGQTVDQSISVLASGLATVAAAGQTLAQDAYSVVLKGLDHANEYVEATKVAVKAGEDAAVGSLKEGIALAAANPYTAYPALTTTALLILPGTRRLLWRMTLGRFVKPESVLASSRSKVELLSSKVQDYGAQIQKLEERVRLAEEEYLRSYQNLRGARTEFQRLSRQVASSEQSARDVVRNLRAIKAVDHSLAVRGEAANQAASLRTQLAACNKAILRIARRDI